MGVHIPIEIIACILMKLKLKALIRSQSVCKEWRSLIQNPDSKLSYRGRRRVLALASCKSLAVTSITSTLRIKTLFKSSDDYPSFLDTFSHLHKHGWCSGVWCTCKGMVLFSVGKHILLWNPSIRCCTKVLELPRLKDLPRYTVVSGLCYVPSTGDYKAVLFLGPDGIVLAASLKNKEWQQVLFPYNVVSLRECVNSINFHNTLHWRVRDSLERGWNKIVYFDPECDEFKELARPWRG